MTLKITTLIENQPDEAGALAFEHGLSLYIEFAGKRLLFDTGQTGAFVDNARKLGVDLTTLDAVVLSHGHYDHSGGILAFSRINPQASIYMMVSAGEKPYITVKKAGRQSPLGCLNEVFTLLRAPEKNS